MGHVTKPIKVYFTDFWAHHNPRFYETWFVYKILKKHFPLEISERPDVLFFSVHGERHWNYGCHKIQYMDEPVHPKFWCADFAISFDYSDDPRHLRLPNYVFWFTPEYTLERLLKPKTENDLRELEKRKKKFCCFIVSNAGGKERNAFFDKLSTYKRVDSAGRFRNNIGYELGHKMGDKFAFMEDYKFSLAFENTSMPGYTTEKLMNAKQSDTVPIYWGNPLVHKEINPKSFINFHEYGSFDKLMERVIEVDNNTDLYYGYLKEPVFYNGVPNEYFDEERLVLFFENVLRSMDKPPVSATGLRYKAYQVKRKASDTWLWQASRSVYTKLLGRQFALLAYAENQIF